MEKIKNFILLPLLIAFATSVFNSCQSKMDKCTSCSTSSNITLKAKFDEALGSQDALVRVWYGNQPNDIYDYASIPKSADFSFEKLNINIEENLKCKANKESKIIAYAIYLKGLIHETKAIRVSDIAGIGIYTFSKNKLYHQLYMKDTITTYFKELNSLNCSVDGINITLIYKMLRKIIQPVNTATTFLVENQANLNYLEIGRKSPDQLENRIIAFIRNFKNP
ncbi:MAG: hypothetical protein H7178_13730 [Chitinophagaceae bacterium]|nr:hypothetical protein [Chitinophagaceae bacterium]